MSRIASRWAVASLVLATGLIACNDDDPAGPDGPEDTTLTVLLTDAPGDVEAAWVEILTVYFQGAEGRVDLVTESTGLIELTELVGTTQTLVSDVELDPTSYGQLRMVLGGGVLETKSGEVYVFGGAEHPDGLETTGDLMCPSCSQSGLKVIIPNDDVELEEGDNLMILDFDVAQSFGHQAGASGKWIMRPTIMGILLEDVNGDGVPDVDQVGRIEGTVALGTEVVIPACPVGTDLSITDFVPTATSQTLVDGDGEAIVRTGAVMEDGSFEMNFLASDTYTLGFQGSLDLGVATLDFTAEVDPAEVTVSDDTVDGVSYTITGATCIEP